MTSLLSPLLPQVLVPGVGGSEVEDRGQPVELLPDEAAIVSAAAAKRRRDFALGRFCAHAALAQRGLPQAPIGRGTDGAPLWPDGICGSITHTMGYAAAIIARREDFLGIGVDAEQLGGVTEKLWPRLFQEKERALLMAQADPAISATLLFSAKEACFKAIGAAQEPFMSIEIELSAGGFLARSKMGALSGLFAVGNGLVVTAAYRPAH